ncbi:MAG TPA: DUF5691 domain-containing protein [Xanthobacteraceae bacterium]
MSAHELKTLVVPALLAGTARQPIDFARLLGGAISSGDPKSSLKALVLTGQALRFERPAPPSEYAAVLARNATRANVPEALRPMLVRLFGEGKSGVSPEDNLALGMALALERGRLQPHPFDFPRMDGFLRAHAERLGPDVCAWMDRGKASEEKRGYFDIEVLDDGNWHEAMPARRQRYIEDRRRQDADAARALVEAVWSNEGADLRLRLLQALRSGLSSADRAFLEGLAKDRAPRVRELAERYLSRLPGPAGQNTALKSVMERIVRGQTGLLRKLPTLKLELPATVKGDDWRDWVARSFEDVELEELANAQGLQSAEMIAAAAPDRCLSTAMTIMAFRQGNPVVARQAYEAMPEALLWLEWQLLQSIESLEPKARQELAEFVVRKALAAGTLTPVALAQVHRTLNGPLSDGLMEEILRAPVWSKWSAAPEGHHLAVFAPVAALCSSAKRPALRRALAEIDPAHIRPVLQFHDILDSLEKVSPHE